MVRRRLVVAFLGGLFLAPSVARAEDWFDAYARGLDALKKGDAPRAAEAFERAIRKRAEPGENLITYGTNRLAKYHPYVRLAEAQAHAGRLAEARAALKQSESSGREPAEERGRVAALLAEAEKRVAAVVIPTPAPATTPAAPPTPAPTPPPTPQVQVTAAPATPAATPATGVLDLRSDPLGATVLLGNRLLGTTPLQLGLAPGTYSVTLRRQGSADQTFTVRIEPGRRTSESRTLVATGDATPAPASSAPAAPEPEVASLVVYSQPPGASVYLDDEPIGETDPSSGRLVKSHVAPGAHRLRLTRAGHADATQEVQVAGSGPTTVRAALTPAPAPGGLPLGWLAAVAAALALAAGGLLLWRRGRREEPQPTRILATVGSAATRVSAPTVRPTGGRPNIGTSRGTPAELLAELGTQVLEPEKGGGASQKPERFGDYVLLERLGRGGMASVYKADKNGDLCALKRPLEAFLEDPEFLKRFLREAEIGHTLHHPNIIRIFDQGAVGNVPYFTMELVRGETLQAHLRRGGALSPRASTQVVAQVAEALDYAHLKGVIHRDLKPSNIMIGEDGTVKVMDYGIARARRFDGMTLTGSFLGTPDYVAPETAEGKAADARSDLYSLGIVFYEILTGQKPFVGDTPFATLRKHVAEPPTPPTAISPNTPRELEAIVLRLLRKSPDDRYPGAEELLMDLRAFLNRAA